MSKSRRTKRSRLIGVGTGVTVCAALLSLTLPASANVKPHDPLITSGAAACLGYSRPYNYPNYDPFYEVQPLEREEGVDTTSVAFGALGGIALAGATLGISLGIRRHRRSAPGATGLPTAPAGTGTEEVR